MVVAEPTVVSNGIVETTVVMIGELVSVGNVVVVVVVIVVVGIVVTRCVEIPREVTALVERPVVCFVILYVE